MQLWPGYVTSIRQHEQEILMCTEITHKVMRTDTVLDLLLDMQRKGGAEFQQTFKNAVLGLVVLTDYNNRTYRIDDVDFRVSPASKFHMRNDRDISYAEYYAEVGQSLENCWNNTFNKICSKMWINQKTHFMYSKIILCIIM